MLCPECETKLDADRRCANGHAWPLIDGVRRCVNSDLSRTLDPFLRAFKDYRTVAQERLMEPAIYHRLPESGMDHDPGAWQLRKFDLEVIGDLIRASGAPRLRILDVGAWNGWLSHRLAAMGHDVIATDVFTDAYDGLGAVQHYPAKFTAVQADQERLHLFEGPFDLIIAQRCTGYFVDLSHSIEQMRSMLAPGGTLIFTGVNVYRDPRSVRKRLAQSALRFKERYGLPFFFKPVKGYADLTDQRTLEAQGMALHLYPQLNFKNFISRPFKRKPLYYYATWHRPLNDA